MIDRKFKNPFWLLGCFISVFLPIGLSGCVGLGEEVRLLPTPEGKWQNDPGNYSRDNTVIFKCEDLDVIVFEIPLRGRTYSVGFILPVIPFPVGYDITKGKPNLAINLEVNDKSGNNNFQKDSISIGLSGRTYESNHVESAHWRRGYIHYTYYFSIPKSETDGFSLNFDANLSNCEIQSIDFKLNKKVALGVAAQ